MASSPSSLNKVAVLPGASPLDAALDHLVHDHVGVDADVLLDLVREHGPPALDEQRAGRRPAVRDRADAVRAAHQSQGERGPPDGALVGDLVCVAVGTKSVFLLSPHPGGFFSMMGMVSGLAYRRTSTPPRDFPRSSCT